jgi:hypothetical protein
MSIIDISYRYFLVDLLTNEVIAEVPFQGVSYERVLRKAGGFSGSIPVIAATQNLDLYEVTMPGRTAVYVMRNDVVVWGGIIWARKYQQQSKTLQVDASEFTSYLYHRHIWQTLVYGSEYIGVSSFSVTNKVATITTEIPHGFSINNFVRVTYTNPVVNGTYQVTSVPSSNSFTYVVDYKDITNTPITSGAARKLIDTYDFVRDILYQMGTDLAGISFANEVLDPSKKLEAAVVSKRRDDGLVTIRTSSAHSIIPGQEVELVQVGSGLDASHIVTEVPDDTTFKFRYEGGNIVETSLSGISSFYVTNRSLTSKVATITTHLPHNAATGQTAVLTGIDSFFSERLDQNFDGRFVITGTPTPTTFTYAVPDATVDIPAATVSGGTVTLGSKAIYGTFGPYLANANIGLEVGTNETSGLYQNTQYIRGFELKTVGELLEDYSNNLYGFEYRIDCDYDYGTGSFTRSFVLLNIENPNNVQDVVAATDEERLGYNKIVFEYPGSISDFTVEESAENAATRFFVEGKINDLSDAASQPYSVASDLNLLNNPNGRSWPLLDQVEIIDNTFNEDILYSYAEEYLYESKPPMGDFTVTVNGALNPVLGTYNPGDWCTLIINDPFVLARLANDQEPRKDIIVRKINSFKVTVPDAPSFPEVVTLELITDWKVDNAGQTSGLTRTIGGQ